MTYKQDFIDKNPYLTYSGKADSAYDGEGGEPYVLPPATADTLGGVKVGSGLAISGEGVLSASGGDDIFIVPIYSEQGSAACDITYNEIKQAITDGKAVFGVGDAGTHGNQQFTFILSSVTTNSCVFTSTFLAAPNYTSATIKAVVINSDNTINSYSFFPAKDQ